MVIIKYDCKYCAVLGPQYYIGVGLYSLGGEVHGVARVVGAKLEGLALIGFGEGGHGCTAQVVPPVAFESQFTGALVYDFLDELVVREG